MRDTSYFCSFYPGKTKMRLTSLRKPEAEYMLLSERMSQNSLDHFTSSSEARGGSLVTEHWFTDRKVLTFCWIYTLQSIQSYKYTVPLSIITFCLSLVKFSLFTKNKIFT